MKKWEFLGYLIMLLVLAFACWLVYIFVTSIQASNPSIKAAIIGFMGVLSAALAGHFFNRKREIQARHFTFKQEGYSHMINLLSELLLSEKLGKKLTDKQLYPKMMEFKKALLTWGNPETITIWNEYEIACIDKENIPETVVHIEKMLRAIRKDLGHDDNQLKVGQLFSLFLNPEAKKELFEKVDKT